MRTVLLADMPPMLRDVLANSLGSRPDFNVVHGDVADRLAAAASAAKADVAIVASRDPADLAAIDAGLAANLSILAISLDGTSAYLHKISCETLRLGDLSPDGILAALAPPSDIVG
jgi:DNA-binding NarL/FixJ family response regulator